MSFAEKLRLQERLAVLGIMEYGWYDGEEGRPPTEKALFSAQKVIAALIDCGMSKPYIYPTIPGGVQVEWDVGEGDWDVEVVFDPDGSFQGYAFGDDWDDVRHIHLLKWQEWPKLSEWVSDLR